MEIPVTTERQKKDVCGITFLEEARKKAEEYHRKLKERIGRLSVEQQAKISDKIDKMTEGKNGGEYLRLFGTLLEKYLTEAGV